MATKQEIEYFMNALNEKIRVFDVSFRHREKNLQALADLEITAIQRRDFLLNLTIENYYTGPKVDTYDLSLPDYYEFGIIIKKIEVYIKISLGKPNKSVDCMSFHPAEFKIKYPFK